MNRNDVCFVSLENSGYGEMTDQVQHSLINDSLYKYQVRLSSSHWSEVEHWCMS